MLRALFTRVVRSHDFRLPREPGEAGVDYLHRNVRRRHRRSARRLRRQRSWLFGWFWRWMYAPYHRSLDVTDRTYLQTLSVNEYTREMIRRQGFERKIIPVMPIPMDCDITSPGPMLFGQPMTSDQEAIMRNALAQAYGPPDYKMPKICTEPAQASPDTH